MSYQSSIGSYNFDNITVSVGDFSDPPESNSTTYGPGIVNIDGSYQTVVLRSTPSVSESTFNVISFNRQIYSGYGNKILFCFFPICYTNNKNIIPKLMQYTTLTKEQLQNYSTISITPQGNFITSPIILDRIFCENGLYATNTQQKNLTSTSHNYVSSNSNCTVFNWEIKQGHTYLINKSNGESTDTSSSMSIRTFNFGETIQRTDNNKNSTSKFPRFKYIYGQNNVILYGAAKHQKATDNQQLCVRRVYQLKNWNMIHPQKNSDEDIGSLEVDKYPFFFMIKLSRRSKGRAVLSFGPSQIPIKIYVSRGGNVLSVGRNNINVDLQYDQKNPPRLPFFMKHPSLKQAISMIVYPTYLGVSIQSGIQQGGKNIDSRTGGSFFKPNGNFCKFGGIRPGYGGQNKVYTRNFPTFQSWVTHYKKESPSEGVQHIFAQPWQLSWCENDSDPLKLQFDNASGSFMFAPLHFLPYARFRMYFKGIKAGKYDSQTNIPQGADDFPSDDQSCSSGKVWQYTYRSKVQDPKAEQKGVQSISHEYFGSVLFSCQYCYNTADAEDRDINVIETSKTFITCPKSAYRIPPPSFNNTDAKNRYFSTYSMDAYYFDFQIDMSEVASADGQTLPRLPIQILGVLILQQVIAVKSLVDNGNGKFEMKLQSNVIAEESTDIIPIYKSCSGDCCSSLADWYKCILSVNVTHNQQGSTGSITVDKYALMGQQMIPKQCIGGLSLEIKGGNTNIINISLSSESEGDSTFRNSSRLFTGYVTKMSTNDSANSDTITMTLQGIQKKLSQIKIINPPFWDGDKLEDILKWLSFYAGVNIKYDDDGINIFDKGEVLNMMADGAKEWYDKNGEKKTLESDDVPIVPVSSVFSRPAVNYKSGQDCFTVLKNVCFKQCNHRFVLQPDGNAYIFTQSRMAMPLACTTNDDHCHKACIDPNLIMNFSIQPLMNNLYNFVITASLQGSQQGTKQTGIGDALSGIKLNKKAQQVQYDGSAWGVDIPWSKTIAMKHEGYMSQSQLTQQHNRNMMTVKNYMLNLKVTIPGNTNIWIYDKATIFGVEYYVTQVSHSVDLSTKRFTTDVTLCSCIQNVN